MIPRAVIYARQTGILTGPLADLRQSVENRGAIVVATCLDDARITGRGKYAGWRRLLARLDTVDQIVVSNVGDIPGRTVADLLKVLGVLRRHGVGLCLHAENIDTDVAGFALLEIIAAYR
jgi:hypothetical protein